VIDFAEKLKSLREAAGMTQPQLAEAAGMNRFGIAKLEQREREPSWATVQKLAKALGVTCQEFADCEDIPEDEPVKKPGKAVPPKVKPTRVGEAFKPAAKKAVAKKPGKRIGDS
jgi:transcriptional regulator with XRE-family HTH domain